MKLKYRIKTEMNRLVSFFLIVLAITVLEAKKGWADKKDEYLVAATNQILEKTETAYQEFSALIDAEIRDADEKDAYHLLFAQDLYPYAQDLLTRVEDLVSNEELDFTLEERIERANLILEISLDMDFDARKILKKIKTFHKDDRTIDTFFLEQKQLLPSEPSINLQDFQNALRNRFQPKGQSSSKKCAVCSKKVRHLDLSCRCGSVFCKTHFMPEDHNCTFDYKTLRAAAWNFKPITHFVPESDLY